MAGDGALYFDPLDIEDMAAAIGRVLVEPELRSELVVKGLENIKRFSWKKTAQETLSVLEMAVSDK